MGRDGKGLHRTYCYHWVEMAQGGMGKGIHCYHRVELAWGEMGKGYTALTVTTG